MAEYTPHPDYNKLPTPIKMNISEKEYAWLTDEQRENLLEDLCNPDYLGE